MTLAGHIYVKALTPTQTYPVGLEAESSSTSIMCVCAGGRACVCVVLLGGLSQVCALSSAISTSIPQTGNDEIMDL